MKHTKYYLQQLRDVENDGIAVPMMCYMPMNTPLMLVRVNDQLRLKRVQAGGRDRPGPRFVLPEQMKLL